LLCINFILRCARFLESHRHSTNIIHMRSTL